MKANRPPNRRRADLAACGATCVLLALVAGCSPYQIQGKVIEGAEGLVTVVSPQDRRLNSIGVDGAKVELTLDPTSISPKLLGNISTGHTGRFTLPVGELGAGMLNYELGVLSTGRGFKSVYQQIPLPGQGKQLLIVLEAGRDRNPPKQDFLKETQQIGEQLLRNN